MATSGWFYVRSVHSVHRLDADDERVLSAESLLQVHIICLFDRLCAVDVHSFRNSFMSKDELLGKLRESGISIVNDSDLPQRTKFTESLSDLLFDDNRSIQVQRI